MGSGRNAKKYVAKTGVQPDASSACARSSSRSGESGPLRRLHATKARSGPARSNRSCPRDPTTNGPIAGTARSSSICSSTSNSPMAGSEDLRKPAPANVARMTGVSPRPASAAPLHRFHENRVEAGIDDGLRHEAVSAADVENRPRRRIRATGPTESCRSDAETKTIGPRFRSRSRFRPRDKRSS